MTLSPGVVCQYCGRPKRFTTAYQPGSAEACHCPNLDYPDPVECPVCKGIVRSTYDREHDVKDVTTLGSRKQVIAVVGCRR